MFLLTVPGSRDETTRVLRGQGVNWADAHPGAGGGSSEGLGAQMGTQLHGCLLKTWYLMEMQEEV